MSVLRLPCTRSDQRTVKQTSQHSNFRSKLRRGSSCLPRAAAEMNHSDMVKQNLEILGLESLEGVSLGQLLADVAERMPSNVSESRILNIYAMWLHSRLITIDISDEASFANEICHWYHFLKAVTDDNLIVEAFCEWQRGAVTADPTSWRRLSIAEVELRKLIPDPPSDPEPSPPPAMSDSHHGYMHPDRVKMSQGQHPVIELDDDDQSDIVELSSRPCPKDSTLSQDRGQQGGQQDLSFLTGSNMLPLFRNPKSPPPEPRHRRLRRPSPGACAKEIAAREWGVNEAKTANEAKANEANMTRKEFICDRCGLKGRHITRE